MLYSLNTIYSMIWFVKKLTIKVNKADIVNIIVTIQTIKTSKRIMIAKIYRICAATKETTVHSVIRNKWVPMTTQQISNSGSIKTQFKMCFLCYHFVLKGLKDDQQRHNFSFSVIWNMICDLVIWLILLLHSMDLYSIWFLTANWVVSSELWNF